jgi:two-component system KDP operon response regulator KdpE
MANPDPVVVVIEDDPPIRRFLRTSLGAHGFRVHETENGQRGVAEVGACKPDIVILDLGLPDMEGVDVVKAIRAWSELPIVILSARGAEQDKIDTLDAGADDYLTKPFGLGELLARIRAALRRAARGPEQTLAGLFVLEGLEVDPIHRKVTVDGEEIHLTPIQYRLLAVLVKHAGKVLTHKQILKEVREPAHSESTHYLRIYTQNRHKLNIQSPLSLRERVRVRAFKKFNLWRHKVYMSQLRQKLEADPAQPKYLLTESGVGYRLRA